MEKKKLVIDAFRKINNRYEAYVVENENKKWYTILRVQDDLVIKNGTGEQVYSTLSGIHLKELYKLKASDKQITWLNESTIKSEQEKSEEYERLKNEIQITDLAEEMGFHLVRKGRYISLSEHDSVMIDTQKNLFTRNSNSHGGTSIDFAMEFGNYDTIHEVLKDFTERLGSGQGYTKKYAAPSTKQECDIVSEIKDTDLVLPERAHKMKNVFAYLIQSRHINKDIVSEFVADYRLYQDTKGNCVFVSYDQEKKPIFANYRGTNTEKRFMGDIPGSDYSKCFHVSNKSKKLIVTESIIDSMSIMTMKRKLNFQDKEYDYLALSSSNKYEALATYAKNYDEILLALDNDESGNLFTRKSMELLMEMDWNGYGAAYKPQFGKDWNEELQYCDNNGIRYDYLQLDPNTQELSEEYCKLMYAYKDLGQDFKKNHSRMHYMKKEIAEYKEALESTELPKKMLSLMDEYYKHPDLLKYSGDPKDDMKIITEHYNKKINDFQDAFLKKSTYAKKREQKVIIQPKKNNDLEMER